MNFLGTVLYAILAAVVLALFALYIGSIYFSFTVQELISPSGAWMFGIGWVVGALCWQIINKG